MAKSLVFIIFIILFSQTFAETDDDSKTLALTSMVTEQAVILGTLVVSLGKAQVEMADLKKTTPAEIADLKKTTRADIEYLKKTTQAEIADLKKTTRADIEYLRKTARDEYEELKKSGAENVTALQGQLDSLTTRYTAAQVEIEELKKTGQENVTSLEEQLETGLSEAQVEIDELKNTTEAEIKELKTSGAGNVTALQGQLNRLTTRITTEIEGRKVTWPKRTDRFCILSNGGSCPAGFTRTSGYMKAIHLGHGGSSGHVRRFQFGDSKIACHNNDCSARDKNIGDIYLYTCCK